MRVLLVDDEPSHRAVMRMILLGAGHWVTECADGQVALDRLLNERLVVDLVVLDICLPGKDGFEILRELRASTECHVPVLFVSVRANSEDIAAGFRAGAAGYLAKPFRRQEFVEVIARIVQQQVVSDAHPCEGTLEVAGPSV